MYKFTYRKYNIKTLEIIYIFHFKHIKTAVDYQDITPITHLYFSYIQD